MAIDTPTVTLALLASDAADEVLVGQALAAKGMLTRLIACRHVEAMLELAPFEGIDCLILDLSCPGAEGLAFSLAQARPLKPMVLLSDSSFDALGRVLCPGAAHWVPKSKEGLSLLPKTILVAKAASQAIGLGPINSIMERVHEGGATLDRRGVVLGVNSAFESIFHYAAGEIVGQSISRIFSDQDNVMVQALLAQIAEGQDQTAVRELMTIRRDGSLFPVQISLSGSVGVHGAFITCAIRDLSENKAILQRASYLAHHDMLTDLPNRILFTERLTKALTLAQDDGRYLGVLCLDLVGFTKVNDTLGHDEGDRLLSQAAKRLTDAVYTGMASRFASDEFAVVLPSAATVEHIAEMSERIRAALAAPYYIGGQELNVPADIGVSIFPNDGVDPIRLLRHAETALHAVKRQPGVHLGFFDAAMSNAAVERLVLEQALKDAIAKDQFELYFQPQIDLSTGQLTGAEALIRWHHPQMGMISPLKFIPVAEETGLIVPLGEWIIRTACAQIKVWENAGLPKLRLGVNISGRQFHEPGLSALVVDAIAKAAVAPELLDLELTESMLMADGEGTLVVLRQLAELGITLSVDDFGTGYSSLAYLKRFPVHTVKIDRAFIRDIIMDEEDRMIVQAIISLAHSLSLRTIAEGVETVEQAALLATMGCDEVQGFLYSMAMPSGQFIDFVRNWTVIAL